MTKEELYYQIALAQYQEQFRRSAGFDTRAGSMMTAAAALAGFGAIVLRDFWGQTGSVWPIAVAVLLAGAFIAAAVSAISGLQPRNWRFNPDPSGLADHLHSPKYEEAGLTVWIGDELTKSVAFNNDVLNVKGRAVRCAAIFVGFMAVLVIALAVVVNVG